MKRCIQVSSVLKVVAVLSVAMNPTAYAGSGGDDAPPATVTGPVTGGGGVSLVEPKVESLGYVEEEYFIEGTAANYQPTGRLTSDGKWAVDKTDTAPYKTRLVVWRPEDPAEFNGTVAVEWLNVSAGFDSAVDWQNVHNYLVREGAIYVGVSAQAVGVQGGIPALQNPLAPPPGGLKAGDPERYGSLTHPGDAYSYDIYSQAGEVLRGRAEGVNPLEGVRVRRLIAMGESQSAGRMATYVNAIHPIAPVYDAFLVHSRGATSAPFGDRVPDQVDPTIPEVVKIRKDVDVPVLIFQTEGDLIVLGGLPARQPDSKNVRTWELTGASHADAYQAGATPYSITDLGDGTAEAGILDPANASGGVLGCDSPINANGQYAVVMAALARLERWVGTDTPPGKHPRIETTGTTATSTVVRDQYGVARGGIRTPIIMVPLAANDGEENAGPVGSCRLFGHTKPFDAATLAQLYTNGHADYVKAFDKAVDKAVKSGIWLKPEADHFKAAAAQLTFP